MPSNYANDLIRAVNGRTRSLKDVLRVRLAAAHTAEEVAAVRRAMEWASEYENRDVHERIERRDGDAQVSAGGEIDELVEET